MSRALLRNRDADVTLAQIAKDFGVLVGTLDKWMRHARVEDGGQPGVTASESAELFGELAPERSNAPGTNNPTQPLRRALTNVRVGRRIIALAAVVAIGVAADGRR